MSETFLWLSRLLFLTALVAGTYLAVTPVDYPVIASVSDKIEHFSGFLVLALLLDYALRPTAWSYWLAAFPLLLGYGALIEVVQYFIAYRSADVRDWLADAAGLITYGLLRKQLRGLLPGG